MKDISESNVLIVDDTVFNVDVLVESLCDEYVISVALDGKTALETIRQNKPDIILLDIMMPEMSGYDVCRQLKKDKEYRDIPIIFLTAMSDINYKTMAFDMGGVDYITKPFEIKEVKARVLAHLSFSRAKKEREMQNTILEEKVAERTKELSLMQDVTIEVFASLAECRDPQTSGHIRRTKEYVKLLAEHSNSEPTCKYKIPKEDIKMMYKTAPLHDIGKIGISDAILLKPGKLTDEEYEIMKTHTTIGHESILSIVSQLESADFLKFALEVCRSHQEKWDGSGYPDGLVGEAIPLSGRLMAVADVYDALVSKRPYKEPFPHSRACQIINDGSGKHFDPECVKIFNQVSEDFKAIAIKHADFEEELATINN